MCSSDLPLGDGCELWVVLVRKIIAAEDTRREHQQRARQRRGEPEIKREREILEKETATETSVFLRAFPHKDSWSVSIQSTLCCCNRSVTHWRRVV